jgi:hypothetical protein
MISNQGTWFQYLANSVTTAFSFPNKIFQASDLAITLIAGNETAAQLNYVFAFVSGNTFQNTVLGLTATVSNVDVDTGATVTFSAAPTTGFTVDLRTDTPDTQSTSLKNQGPYLPDIIEEAFDRATRIVQDTLRLTYTFGIHGPDSESIPWPAFPPPAQRLGLTAMFDPVLGLPTVGTPVSQMLTAALVGQFIFPPLAIEGSLPVALQYPYGNLLRYGIIPNSSGAAASNATILQGLLNPLIAGLTGTVYSPNTTGSDVYSFGDICPVRDYVDLDLGGTTWQLNKLVVSAYDANAGFLFGVRGVKVHNGNLTINYPNGVMAAVAIGARGNEAFGGVAGWPFQNSYDATLITLPAGSQGRCRVYDLNISTNSPASNPILMTGGLDDVIIEMVRVDGTGVASGVYYEYGYATDGSGVGSARLSSHAKNLIIRNCYFQNIIGGLATAVELVGAYQHLVENIYGKNCGTMGIGRSGESMFYQPWADDLVGKKATKIWRNINGQSLTSHGVIFQGTTIASGTYLGDGLDGPIVVGNPPLTAAQLAAAEIGLGRFILDGATLGGVTGFYGVLLSAESQSLRDVTASGFTSGIVAYNEAEMIVLETCKVAGCSGTGFDLSLGNNNADSPTSPPYARKKITARNCIAINNGTASPGNSPGFNIANDDVAILENCRSGAEAAFGDSADDTTQGNAFSVGTNAQNVILRGCHAGPQLGGCFAYYNVVNAPNFAAGNTVSNPTGVVTYQGAWANLLNGISADRGDAGATLTAGGDFQVQLFATALTANRSISLPTTTAVQGDKFRIVRTGLGAFTLSIAGLKVIPASTAAFVDVEYNGTAWIYTGYGAL